MSQFSGTTCLSSALFSMNSGQRFLFCYTLPSSFYELHPCSRLNLVSITTSHLILTSCTTEEKNEMAGRMILLFIGQALHFMFVNLFMRAFAVEHEGRLADVVAIIGDYDFMYFSNSFSFVQVVWLSRNCMHRAKRAS